MEVSEENDEEGPAWACSSLSGPWPVRTARHRVDGPTSEKGASHLSSPSTAYGSPRCPSPSACRRSARLCYAWCCSVEGITREKSRDPLTTLCSFLHNTRRCMARVERDEVGSGPDPDVIDHDRAGRFGHVRLHHRRAAPGPATGHLCQLRSALLSPVAGATLCPRRLKATQTQKPVHSAGGGSGPPHVEDVWPSSGAPIQRLLRHTMLAALSWLGKNGEIKKRFWIKNWFANLECPWI
jgi:hypothetical protein